MGILSGNEFITFMVEFIDNQMRRDVAWKTSEKRDLVVKMCEEVSKIPYSDQCIHLSKAIQSHFKHELDGVKLLPQQSGPIKDIGKKYGVIMDDWLIASILPNPSGMEIIAFNTDKLTWHPDAMYIIAHELHHLKQIRRGDLVFRNDGVMIWNGWGSQNYKDLNGGILHFNLNFGDPKALLHRKIIAQPWEAEAYALTLPVSRWDDYFNDDTKDYLISNMSSFNPN